MNGQCNQWVTGVIYQGSWIYQHNFSNVQGARRKQAVWKGQKPQQQFLCAELNRETKAFRFVAYVWFFIYIWLAWGDEVVVLSEDSQKPPQMYLFSLKMTKYLFVLWEA